MFDIEDVRCPLNQSPSLLATAIDENLVERVAKIDPYRKRIFAVGLNTAISTAGKIPYLFVAMRIALPYPLAVLGAAVELIAFGLLDVWVIKDTANDLCGARTTGELQLLAKNGRGIGSQSLIMIAAIAGSAFAQLPSALPALNYQVPYTQASFAVLMASGMYYSIRSLKLSFEKTMDKRNEFYLEHSAQLTTARQDLTSMIGNRQHIFLHSRPEEQLQFAHSIKNLDVTTYLNQVISSTITDPQIQQTTDKIIYGFGVYLAVFMQGAFALYTWVETEKYFVHKVSPLSQIALLSAFTGAEVAANVYLMGRSMIETTQVVANTLLCRNNTPSIAAQLNPTLTQNCKLIAALIALIGCYPTTWVIWGDFFTDPHLALYFQITMSFNFFLVLLTANLHLAEQVVEESILHRGTQDQKDILHLWRDLQQLQNLIGNSSLADFSAFLREKHLPNIQFNPS